MRNTVVLALLLLNLCFPVFTYAEVDDTSRVVEVAEVDGVNSEIFSSDWIKLISSVLVGVVAALITQLFMNFRLEKSHHYDRALLEKKQQDEFNMLVIKNQLEHINKQLDQFYGPMLAISQAGSTLWERFCSDQKRSPTKFFTQNHVGNEVPLDPVVDKEIYVSYMRVMREIFYPMDHKREILIIENAALIELDDEIGLVQNATLINSTNEGKLDDVRKNNHFPEMFINVIAHTAGLRSIIKRWDSETCDELNIYNLQQSLKSGDQDKIGDFYPAFEFPLDLDEYLRKHWGKLRNRKRNLEEKLSNLITEFNVDKGSSLVQKNISDQYGQRFY